MPAGILAHNLKENAIPLCGSAAERVPPMCFALFLLAFQSEFQEMFPLEEFAEQKRATNLPPPLYLSDESVWVDGDGKLNFLLLNPNADGLVTNPSARVIYDISLNLGCNELYSDQFSATGYPALFQPNWKVPSQPYEIHISRIDLASSKRDGGSGTVLVGPPLGSGFSQVPSDPVEIKRWLLHMPKLASGFEATLTFHNRFPDLPASVYVVGFDAAGKVVANSQKKVAVIGLRPQTKLYRNVPGEPFLYESSFKDKISHLGIVELGGTRYVSLSLSYKSLTTDAMSATVAEADLEKGGTVGSQFLLGARESLLFWDGVAVLNLTGKKAVQVHVNLHKRADDSLLESKALEDVPPGSKRLVVLSDLFFFQPDTYYSVETASSGQQIQVLGLKGTLVEIPPLMVTTPVVKKK